MYDVHAIHVRTLIYIYMCAGVYIPTIVLSGNMNTCFLSHTHKHVCVCVCVCVYTRFLLSFCRFVCLLCACVVSLSLTPIKSVARLSH